MRFARRYVVETSRRSHHYSQATRFWPWTWYSAPILLLSTDVLRMAAGRTWLGFAMKSLALMSATTLSVAAIAGMGFSLLALWERARECPESSSLPRRMCTFVLESLFLVPLWLWCCYWTVFATLRQHIVFGQWDNVVALASEPQRFLISLVGHAVALVTIPAYWMTQARGPEGSGQVANQRDEAPTLHLEQPELASQQKPFALRHGRETKTKR